MALQSPINAFRVESKAPDGTLKSGLKRAPFPIAFYNVYRERERRACDMRAPCAPADTLPPPPPALYSYSPFPSPLSSVDQREKKNTLYRISFGKESMIWIFLAFSFFLIKRREDEKLVRLLIKNLR